MTILTVAGKIETKIMLGHNISSLTRIRLVSLSEKIDQHSNLS